MFGIALASLAQISDKEQARYQSLYCGLCHALKTRYGQIPRMTLNYDLTFFILLMSSLTEPDETTGCARCLAHPTKRVPYTTTPYSYDAADLCVALAYHKCLDDIHDDHTLAPRIAQRGLHRAYEAAKERKPVLCNAIEEHLGTIRALEADPSSSPDATANTFGRLMALIFAFEQSPWASYLDAFGYHTGRLIYLMDAAIDLDDDRASGSYNPFVKIDASPDEMQITLEEIAGHVAQAFEKLPLEQDLHLLRSVIYAGIWQKYLSRREQAKKKTETDTTRSHL